jgi:hypothetical protein
MPASEEQRRSTQRPSSAPNCRRGRTTAVPGRFDSALAPSPAVTRGLGPRVSTRFRIDFANAMDARVKPAHDNKAAKINREPM